MQCRTNEMETIISLHANISVRGMCCMYGTVRGAAPYHTVPVCMCGASMYIASNSYNVHVHPTMVWSCTNASGLRCTHTCTYTCTRIHYQNGTVTQWYAHTMQTTWYKTEMVTLFGRYYIYMCVWQSRVENEHYSVAMKIAFIASICALSHYLCISWLLAPSHICTTSY